MIAVSDFISPSQVCKVCKLRGAMVACVQRGCDRAFHYYCAIQDGEIFIHFSAKDFPLYFRRAFADCYLDYEQFCLYCSRHKKKNATPVSLGTVCIVKCVRLSLIVSSLLGHFLLV